MYTSNYSGFLLHSVFPPWAQHSLGSTTLGPILGEYSYILYFLYFVILLLIRSNAGILKSLLVCSAVPSAQRDQGVAILQLNIEPAKGIE